MSRSYDSYQIFTSWVWSLKTILLQCKMWGVGEDTLLPSIFLGTRMSFGTSALDGGGRAWWGSTPSNTIPYCLPISKSLTNFFCSENFLEGGINGNISQVIGLRVKYVVLRWGSTDSSWSFEAVSTEYARRILKKDNAYSYNLIMYHWFCTSSVEGNNLEI